MLRLKIVCVNNVLCYQGQPLLRFIMWIGTLMPVTLDGEQKCMNVWLESLRAKTNLYAGSKGSS